MTYQVWREKLLSTLLKMRKYDEYSKLGEELKDCMECDDYCDYVVDTIIDEARRNKKFASHMLQYNLGDIFVRHSEIYTACIFTAAGY
jgi:hypothetical protein